MDVQVEEDQAVVVASSEVVEEVPAQAVLQLHPQDQQLDQHQLSQHPSNHPVWDLEEVASWVPWRQVWLSEPAVRSLTKVLEP